MTKSIIEFLEGWDFNNSRWSLEAKYSDGSKATVTLSYVPTAETKKEIKKALALSLPAGKDLRTGRQRQ